MSKVFKFENIKTCKENCDVWKKFPLRTGFVVCNNPNSDHYKHVLCKLHPICNKAHSENWRNPSHIFKQENKTMTNLEVAKCFIENALAYLEGGDVDTVAENLKFIKKLLDNPNGVNGEYTWDDFK